MIVSWLREDDAELLRGAATFLANVANTDENEIKNKVVGLGGIQLLSRLLLQSADPTVHKGSRRNCISNLVSGVCMALANLSSQKKTK
jgi:hypothetical protein